MAPRKDPGLRFTLLALGAAGALTVAMLVSTDGQGWPVLWLVAITAVTFALYGWDKFVSARLPGRDRVPERVLLLMALVGGTAGAVFAMVLFRHKTSKTSFRLWFAGAMIVQMALLVWWMTSR